MKRIILSLAILLGIGISNVNAQITFSGGVKAAANMSNYILKDMPQRSSKMKVGASVGGVLKIELMEYFAIQPELMFHFKASDMENKMFNHKITSDYKYWGVDLPVYAVGQMSLGNGKMYLGIGPYIGFGFSSKDKTLDLNLYDNDTFEMKRFDFGLGAIIGYEFDNGIFINGGYQMGLINLVDKAVGDPSMRPQTLNLGVGYKF